MVGMEWGNRREIIGFTPRVGVGLNNQRPAQVEAGDWRSQFQLDLRHRVLSKQIETFKRLIPFEGEEGLLELERIAGGLEEKIYVAASSQPDFLWKIYLKMLTMEMKSQTAPPLSNLKRYRVSA